MSENVIRATPPLGPDRTTLLNPEHTISDESGTRLLCWCPVNRCGAIYHTEANLWTMHVPISFADFLQAIKLHGMAPAACGDDLARWIQANTQPAPGTPTAPGGRC